MFLLGRRGQRVSVRTSIHRRLGESFRRVLIDKFCSKENSCA